MTLFTTTSRKISGLGTLSPSVSFGGIVCARLGVSSYAEFCEASEQVKPNVAAGRDNIPGTTLRLLRDDVRGFLYCPVVERLAGREDYHVKDWAEFDVCLVPENGDISSLGRWRPISLVPSLFKL